MRHETATGDDRLLRREDSGDRRYHSNLMPETLENLISTARQKRAEATAELLARPGAAMIHPFRGTAAPKPARTRSPVEGEPQRAF
jgi:hypothetical protein